MTPLAPAPVPESTDVPADDAVPEYMQVLERAALYLPEDQRRQLRRAWSVGAAAHAGQMRKSGEPYITHPVAVAVVPQEIMEMAIMEETEYQVVLGLLVQLGLLVMEMKLLEMEEKDYIQLF